MSGDLAKLQKLEWTFRDKPPHIPPVHHQEDVQLLEQGLPEV